MRKTRKAAAVLTAVAMAAVSAVPAMADEIKDLYDYETQAREVETWNILHSQSAADLNVLTNLPLPALLIRQPLRLQSESLLLFLSFSCVILLLFLQAVGVVPSYAVITFCRRSVPLQSTEYGE